MSTNACCYHVGRKHGTMHLTNIGARHRTKHATNMDDLHRCTSLHLLKALPQGPTTVSYASEPG